MSRLLLVPTRLVFGLIVFCLSAGGGHGQAPDVRGDVEPWQMPAGHYRLDVEHTHVYWRVSHAGFSMTQGRFNRFEGALRLRPDALSRSELVATVFLESVDTNVPELDAVLRSDSLFDVERHPVAVFTLSGLESFGPGQAIASGVLEMNGIAAPIELNVSLNRARITADPQFTRLGVTARGVLNRQLWGFDLYPDIIGQEVEVTINAEFLLDLAERD